jgi:hypothetical protein
MQVAISVQQFGVICEPTLRTSSEIDNVICPTVT